MRRHLIALGSWFIASIFYSVSSFACDQFLSTNGVRDDVLIIVNDNSKDSCSVGLHYAERRGIGRNNIVHVNVPPEYFISWTQFTLFRDQVIRFLQQRITTAHPGISVASCAGYASAYYCPESMDQIRAYTDIRYLVTTKGIPTRMVVDNSGLMDAWAPTSVDNYLRYWTLNYFDRDTKFDLLRLNRAKAFADGRGMRLTDSATDREFIIGRIDGLSAEAANALVDRAIDAEQSGLFGKLISHTAGMNWKDYSRESSPDSYVEIYTGKEGALLRKNNSFNHDPWRYQFGLFAESDSACADYSNSTHYLRMSESTGKTPPQCTVQLSIGEDMQSDAPPGISTSRQPKVNDALAYFGHLDGHATIGYFSAFLNWRKNDSCYVGSTPLCKLAPDPDVCRAESVDIMKEIDTRCAGVANGFIGYNHQSFPVSLFQIWPTDWKTHQVQLQNLALPDVRTDIGHSDTMSLWFRNSDARFSANCYAVSSELTWPAASPCDKEKRINFMQYVGLPQTQLLSSSQPQQFKARLWWRAEQVTKSSAIQVVLQAIDKNNTDKTVIFGPVTVTPQISESLEWADSGELLFTLTPPADNEEMPYNALYLVISSTGTYEGDVGFDDISLKQVGQGHELVKNSSFTEGHEMVSPGDYAANFLNRLNGTAFWGSDSHHESGGHSFASHPLETLIYFMRGLPLGDAVWFAEQHNSGIFYGDPLYSPVAVMFNYPNDSANRFEGSFTLSGSAVNGSAPSSVSTTYDIDYCTESGDFFVCDRANSWIRLFSGAGGAREQNLGTLDGNTLPRGNLLMRLRVISTQVATGRSQNFQDFLTLRNWTGCNIANFPADLPPANLDDWTDTDSDGLVNPCDSDDDSDGYNDAVDPFPRNKSEWLDSDEDGVGNNTDTDDDNDTLSDIYEASRGTSSTNKDTDGDLISDDREIALNLDPLIKNYQNTYRAMQPFLEW